MSYTYDRGRKSTLQPKEWGTVTGGDGKQVNKHMLISWVGAFRGFYKKDESQYSQDFITRMLYSARSIILVISFQAALISGLLAAIFNSFNTVNFVLIVISFVLLHVESNLLNDYFGYRYGHDTPDSPRRRYTLHPLADNIVTVREMKVTIVSILAVLAIIGGYFTLLRGVDIILLAVAGAGILFMYDVSSTSLKTVGMGEIASFVVWGPLMVAGGYYAITGAFSSSALLVSIPYGLGVMSVLLGKHIDQLSFDSGRGIGTLPVRAGESTSLALLVGIILLMYLATAAAVIALYTPFTLLLVFVNIGRLRAAIRTIRADRPKEPPPGYVGWPLWYHRQALRHNSLFGWLYIAGLLIFAALTATGIHIPLF